MRIYRTEKDGIDIWRLSGAVRPVDTRTLVRTLRESRIAIQGCLILDFEHVEHVDYRAFRILEDWFPPDTQILISGLSDYILDIFAFVRKSDTLQVFRDWRAAFHYLMAERGKILEPSTMSAAGQH